MHLKSEVLLRLLLRMSRTRLMFRQLSASHLGSMFEVSDLRSRSIEYNQRINIGRIINQTVFPPKNAQTGSTHKLTVIIRLLNCNLNETAKKLLS